ncbi:helix-turn-helix domain-containing protein [Taibaiella koreensis]|uniref:helix-turn-helix domain-containing protein n=1 Tax=Taibaiella koreensis TaxID=1268548 RepID=UPI000E599ACA|nr:helix-turn-helix domain-containing protein [Taibaiella koreensis]
MQHFKSLADLHRINGLPMPEHPLFSVYRCPKTTTLGENPFTADVYIIGFKKLESGVIMYGRTQYDHENGCMLFARPRQIMAFKNLEYHEDSFIIFIHEDFLNGHFLHQEINKYAFFDYETNEALHLSPREEQIMWDLFFKIDAEYRTNNDEYSRNIMLSHVDAMLRYSQRFYKRQFIGRTQLSGITVSKFNEALAAYFKTGFAEGLPNVTILAAQLHLSPRYLSDLLKQETGKTAIELIHIFLIKEAKNRLRSDVQRVSEIAYELGFDDPSYFSRLFKKETGVTPNQFKKRLLN